MEKPHFASTWSGMSQCDVFEGPSSWNEAIRNNMRKLMGNFRTSLYRIEKLKNSIILQVFDYSQSGSVEGGA